MAIQKIEITQAACRIEDCGFSKNRSKDSQDGARVKKLRIIFDVSNKENVSHLEEMFPGVEHMSAMIAVEEGDAIKLTKSKKPAEVTLSLADIKTKAKIVKMVGARCSAPTLRIAKSAEKTELIVVVTGPITKEELGLIDDYFKADCYGSIVTTNIDLEDAARKKKGNKKGPKASKEQTSLDIENPPDGDDADEEGDDAPAGDGN